MYMYKTKLALKEIYFLGYSMYEPKTPQRQARVIQAFAVNRAYSAKAIELIRSLK